MPQNPAPISTLHDEWTLMRKSLLDWKFWLKVLAIVCPVFWIYQPALHGDWLMDDDLYTYANPLNYDPHRIWKAWFEPGSFIEYYPIQESVQWAIWRMWGKDTFGYHITNVVLHAFSSLLVWRVLMKFNLRWAWLGGMIFAVHPALVESVAWIAELKNTLSLPPFLLAICFYIEFEKHNREQDYFMAVGSFLIAMLCKISMAPFPAVILVYAWWRRGRITWKDIKWTLPFWAIALILSFMTLWCGSYYAKAHQMDTMTEHLNLDSRTALIGLNLGFYLAICLWPFDLLPIYQRWSVDHPTLLQFMPWLVLAFLLGWFWTKRADWGRHAILSLGFFGLILAPFLGFLTVSYMRFTWIMDHFIYIPIIGLIALFVAGVERLARIVTPIQVMLLRGTMVLIIVSMGLSAHRYSAFFVSQIGLWEYTIKRNPEAWPAYNNLAALYLEKSRFEEARKLLLKAVELNTRYYEAEYNLGLTYDHLGREHDALEKYKVAVKLFPQARGSRFMLAQALWRDGNIDGAIEQYEIGLTYHPDEVGPRATLVSLLIGSGRPAQAVDVLNETLRYFPDSPAVHNDLGNALYMLGRQQQAMDEYREALRLNPKMVEAYNNLAGVLQHNGQLDAALEQFRNALQIAPENPKLHVNVAEALARGGRKEEAIKEYETALHYDPHNEQAMAGLAKLRGVKPSQPSQK